MAAYSPEELLIGRPLWTEAAVRALVRRVTGVVMTELGTSTWLRRHGFTPQRPARRAHQQQEKKKKKKARAWLEEEYPAIAARAKTEQNRGGLGGPMRAAPGHGAARPLLGSWAPGLLGSWAPGLLGSWAPGLRRTVPP